jgi:hypothetical protein
MKDVHITTNSWIPLGAAVSVLTFIVAAALWAKQIENKADNALLYQHKYESRIDEHLRRIEDKLDKALLK